MRTVLITGSAGFIGQNLNARLQHEADIRIKHYNRESGDAALAQTVRTSDFVFHLASVMRPADETEFEHVNKALTERILNLMAAGKNNAPFLLASSIQAELDNPYGKSKKAA